MTTTERVTVTLAIELVEQIDRLERNRSRFIAEAVDRELARRHREGLLRSLASPHADAGELADAGLADWGKSLPDDHGGLVDLDAGRGVRWIADRGWVESDLRDHRPD